MSLTPGQYNKIKDHPKLDSIRRKALLNQGIATWTLKTMIEEAMKSEASLKGRITEENISWIARQCGTYYESPRKAVRRLPPELSVSYTIKEQPAKRTEIAGVMGIVDKGHKQHGSNFSSSQTLKNIIDNLFAMVSENQRKVIGGKLKRKYGYDPSVD